MYIYVNVSILIFIGVNKDIPVYLFVEEDSSNMAVWLPEFQESSIQCLLWNKEIFSIMHVSFTGTFYGEKRLCNCKCSVQSAADQF